MLAEINDPVAALSTFDICAMVTLILLFLYAGTQWYLMVPVRAMPWVTRRAIAEHWCGSSGASVATMAITEPAPGGGALPPGDTGPAPVSSLPSRTPPSVNSSREPKLACRKTPTV